MGNPSEWPNVTARIASEIGIKVGCLDKNDWFSPQAVVYTTGWAAWDKTPEDVPNFERTPPPPK
jgi:hypothetical protein